MDDDTRLLMITVIEVFRKIDPWIFYFQLALAVLALLSNLFHLFILGQKSMRWNATNILLMGIAFSDFFYMFFYVHDSVSFILQPDDIECLPRMTWFEILYKWIYEAAQDVFRRLSAWLGVFLTLFRVLIVKFAEKNRFQWLMKPTVSMKLTFAAMFVSCLVSSLQWGRTCIVRYDDWVPDERCTNFPPNSSFAQYDLGLNPFFDDYHDRILKTFLLLDGSCRVAPSFIYPILAALLISELRKATRRREKLQSANTGREDRTTKLIAWMAVLYALGEAPVGISNISEWTFFDSGPLVLTLITELTVLFFTLLILNCSIHFPMCYAMSSQYRSTVKSVLGCSKRSSSASLVVVTITKV